MLLVALLVRVGFSAPIQWSDRFLRLDTYEVEEVTLPQKAGAKLIFDGQNLRCRLERSRTPVHIAYKPFLWLLIASLWPISTVGIPICILV